MGGIPVLNDNQMNALRRVVGTNPKLNLTVTPQSKSRKLPTYGEDVTATGTDVVLAKITGGSAAAGYTVELYSNGRQESSTGTGTVFLPEVSLTGTLPSGTWVLAHLSEVAVTGGNDA